MSLNEDETFIKLNKHLPNVKPAKEIQTLNIGDMQTLQMQKIEEIMLYLIELKKENVELKKQIETCKK